MDTTYFLDGSIRVHKCPEVDAIINRLQSYRECDFEIVVTEVEGGERELSILGCRDLDLGGMRTLEDHLQALGPYARQGAIFERHYEHDDCDVIVAPSPEAGRVALSRLRLQECRRMLEDLVPADRARLCDELREDGT